MSEDGTLADKSRSRACVLLVSTIRSAQSIGRGASHFTETSDDKGRPIVAAEPDHRARVSPDYATSRDIKRAIDRVSCS